MADTDTATRGGGETAETPETEPRKAPAETAGDGGLRAEDRARLKQLLEQRRKKEAAPQREAKAGAGAAGHEPAASPDGRHHTPKRKLFTTKRRLAIHLDREPGEDLPAGADAHPGAGRRERLHTLLLDRLGHNPERVTTAPSSASANPAERASPRKVINWALDLLPLHPGSYTFVDFGSGRGRVVMEATRRPFERVVGIERDIEHHETAMLNLRHWPRSIMACRNVDFVHAHARRWKLPETDLVVYLFDPFGERTMFDLVRRLNQHVETGHRVAVIYLDPAHALPLRESPFFSRVMPLGLLKHKIDWLSPYALEVYVSDNVRDPA